MSRSARPGASSPRLVLGAAQIGQSYGATNLAGRPDRGTVSAILDAVRAHGISHVDTARGYGDSEADLGSAAQTGEPPAIITKIAPLSRSGNANDQIARSWAQSAEALGAASRSVSDLLFHRADDALRPGAWESLCALRNTEGIDRIGVSVQHPDELLDVLALPEIGHVQLPFNVVDRRWLTSEVCGALTDRPDVVVVCRSVFLQGLLLNDHGWPAGIDGAPILSTLDEAAIRTGSPGRAALCLRFVLAQPWVDAVVIGAETSAQVIENASLTSLPPLSADEASMVMSRVPAAGPDLVDPSRWNA